MKNIEEIPETVVLGSCLSLLCILGIYAWRIVAAHYMSKVASKQCLIAFIRKDGEPVATNRESSWGQFYANELDRNNCLPSEEVKTVFNKWFENVKVRKVI